MSNASPQNLSPPTNGTPALKQRVPDGPSYAWLGLPLLRKMRKDLLGFSQQLQQQYGDASCTRIVWESNYEFCHPDWVREALVEKASSFVRWERVPAVFGKLMGHSVLVTDGAVWQRQRRILQPAFSTQRMAGYAALMTASCERMLGPLANQGQQTVAIEHELTQLTMAVIMQTLFSSTAKEEAQAAEHAVRVASAHAYQEFFKAVSLPDWMPHLWKVRAAKNQLKGLVQQHIQKRKQAIASGAPAKNDLLGMLLGLRDEEGDQQALSDEEIHNECMTLFVAGHDTTAAALTWWCWAMTANPDCAERARAEVDAALGANTPSYDDVRQLPYLGQTLREAMRMYPPTPILITRRTAQAVEIGPYTMPKGALLRITPYVMHHDPRWFPQPDRFLPERFAPEAFAKLPRGAYMPFGAGQRVCIGQLFATTEMTLIAAMLLQRFRFERADDSIPTPVLNVTLHPRDPLHIRLIPR